MKFRFLNWSILHTPVSVATPCHFLTDAFCFNWSDRIQRHLMPVKEKVCRPIRLLTTALLLFSLSSHWESDELIFSQTRVRVKRCYTLWVFSVCRLRDNPSSQTKKQSWCDIVSVSLYLPAVCAVGCGCTPYQQPDLRQYTVHTTTTDHVGCL